MKNIFSNSKTFFVILFFSFFMLTILNSCDKTKKFDGTTWVGDYTGTVYGGEYGDIKVDIKGKITLSFTGNEVDIKAKVKETYVYQYQTYTDEETYKATGRYKYEKKKMTITLSDDDDWFESEYDDGKWTGTVEKKEMTLSGVIGERVTFTKE
jgi:hypothetical protein